MAGKGEGVAGVLGGVVKRVRTGETDRVDQHHAQCDRDHGGKHPFSGTGDRDPAPAGAGMRDSRRGDPWC